MTFMGFIALLPDVFKFFNEVQSLISALKQTPEAQHATLMDKVKTVFDESKNNGRPTWG
jgi:hypothetical protein